MIAVCALWNLRGARAVGWGALGHDRRAACRRSSSLAASRARATRRDGPPPPTSPAGRCWGGILVAMWNYMGWDNASTIAGEVERPQRTYPLAMLDRRRAGGADVRRAGRRRRRTPASTRAAGSTGGWVDVGRALGGAWLARAVVVGGVVCAHRHVQRAGALVLAPAGGAGRRRLSAGRSSRRRHPTTARLGRGLVCAPPGPPACSSASSGSSSSTCSLYGLSLLLEFVALVALRLREPELPRPFRVPGGKVGAISLGLGPALLIGLALYAQGSQWTPEGDDPIVPAWC